MNTQKQRLKKVYLLLLQTITCITLISIPFAVDTSSLEAEENCRDDQSCVETEPLSKPPRMRYEITTSTIGRGECNPSEIIKGESTQCIFPLVGAPEGAVYTLPTQGIRAYIWEDSGFSDDCLVNDTLLICANVPSSSILPSGQVSVITTQNGIADLTLSNNVLSQDQLKSIEVLCEGLPTDNAVTCVFDTPEGYDIPENIYISLSSSPDQLSNMCNLAESKVICTGVPVTTFEEQAIIITLNDQVITNESTFQPIEVVEIDEEESFEEEPILDDGEDLDDSEKETEIVETQDESEEQTQEESEQTETVETPAPQEESKNTAPEIKEELNNQPEVKEDNKEDLVQVDNPAPQKTHRPAETIRTGGGRVTFLAYLVGISTMIALFISLRDEPNSKQS